MSALTIGILTISSTDGFIGRPMVTSGIAVITIDFQAPVPGYEYGFLGRTGNSRA